MSDISTPAMPQVSSLHPSSLKAERQQQSQQSLKAESQHSSGAPRGPSLDLQELSGAPRGPSLDLHQEPEDKFCMWVNWRKWRRWRRRKILVQLVAAELAEVAAGYLVAQQERFLQERQEVEPFPPQSARANRPGSQTHEHRQRSSAPPSSLCSSRSTSSTTSRHRDSVVLHPSLTVLGADYLRRNASQRSSTHGPL